MKNADKPAFERMSREDKEFDYKNCGLTKREYFAAHAPQAPDWFSPKMPPSPEKKFISMSPYGNDMPTSEYRAWLSKEAFERLIQWPIFYADELLKQLES